MGRQIVGFILLLLALPLLVLASAHAQPETPDVSRQWVGIIEWDEPTSDPLFIPQVRTYRLNILQDGSSLRATHLVHGDNDAQDLIYTQPLEHFADPTRNPFTGTLTGSTLRFEMVPVYTNHCHINITLEYARVGDTDVLAGELTHVVYPPPPTRAATLTPEEAANAPDVIVGCHAPTGAVVLRRFAPLEPPA